MTTRQKPGREPKSSGGADPGAQRASAPQTAVYLYCLLSAKEPPSLEEVPAGLLETSPPRLLQVDKGLWLIVADAPLPAYSAEAITRGLADLEWVSACALAHEEVVEHFMQKATIIPYKLFTLFSTEARARAHVRQSGSKVSRVISRVSGKEEWGLRVSFDAEKARSAALKRVQREAGEARSGLAFLLRKKQEKDIAQKTSGAAREEVERLFSALSQHVEDARRRPPLPGPDGASVLLEVAFLVSSRGARRFTSSVKREAARLAPEGYQVALSGPWPPYHFITEST